MHFIVYIYIRGLNQNRLLALLLNCMCLPTRYKTFTSYFIQQLFKTLLDLRLITFYFLQYFIRTDQFSRAFLDRAAATPSDRRTAFILIVVYTIHRKP